MGQLVGTLGGVELGDPVQIRIVIERLERAIVDLQNARAPIQPQQTNTVVYGPGTRYATSFTAATTWIIPASQHGLNSRNLHVVCYDTAMKWIVPDSITIDVNNTITVTFFSAQAGTAVVL